MDTPSYRGGWTPEKVVFWLMRDPAFVEWRSVDGNPPNWITKDGTESMMMDDDDDRWLATWKFVADRGAVLRPELAREFEEMLWEGGDA